MKTEFAKGQKVLLTVLPWKHQDPATHDVKLTKKIFDRNFQGLAFEEEVVSTKDFGGTQTVNFVQTKTNRCPFIMMHQGSWAGIVKPKKGGQHVLRVTVEILK